MAARLAFLKQTSEVSLSCFLESSDCWRLESQVFLKLELELEVLMDVTR